MEDGARGEYVGVEGSDSMKVFALLADSGGERRGEFRLSARGERGDRRLPKRWERMLVPGELGRGVRGIPWLESGRKNLLRFGNTEDVLGGDWPDSTEYSIV